MQRRKKEEKCRKIRLWQTLGKREHPPEGWQCWSTDIWTARWGGFLWSSSLSGRPGCTWCRLPGSSQTRRADCFPPGSCTGRQTWASECPERSKPNREFAERSTGYHIILTWNHYDCDRWAWTGRVYFGRDHYIADTSVNSRSFPCREPP